MLPKLKGVQLCTLPGGYGLRQEGLPEAAQRILLERTGVQDIYPE